MITVIDRYAPGDQVKTDWSRLSDLEVGESIYVRNSESGHKSASITAGYHGRRLGRKFSIMSDPQGRTVTRVW